MLSLCFIVLFLWKHGKNKDKLAYIKKNDTFINKSVLWIIVSRITLVTWTPPLILSLRPPCSKHVLTFCSSESWSGSFIAGTAPPFSIKWCANPASNWALFIKCSSTNKLAEKLPRKNKLDHVTLRSFGSWTRLSLPYNQNTETFFRDIVPERVPCSTAKWSASMGMLLLSFFREKCLLYRTVILTGISEQPDFRKGILKQGFKKYWEDFYHYIMNVYTHCQYTFMFKQIVKWILHPMTP